MSDIPAVVLNLARSRDRRAHMEGQLKGRDLSYRFFESTVDYKELTPAEESLHDQRRTVLFRRMPMHKAQIACALSHIRVYEWMIKEHLPRLLIMEDDVTLSDEFFLSIATADQWLPTRWDVINFTPAWNSLERYPDLFRYGPRLYPLASLPNHTVTSLMHPNAMAACYLIHLKAAKFFVSKAYPIRMTADRMTGWTEWSGRRCFTVLPFIAHIKPFKGAASLIDGDPFVTPPDSPYNAPPYPWTFRMHLRWREVVKIPRMAKHMLRTAWRYAQFSWHYPTARHEIRKRLRIFISRSPHFFVRRVKGWVHRTIRMDW